ncbi:MAG TPA: protein-disulfide reductase DsbD [Methylophilaceae bacterium]|nr:protein-disulfide reductase DsbD [Methylophilaceae bacterium]
MTVSLILRALILAWLLPLLVFSPIAAADTGKSLFVDSVEEEVLSPDEAFKLKISALNGNTLQAIFEIAPGHYLYRDRIKVEPAKSSQAGFTITRVDLPQGEPKQDAYFGLSQVFHNAVTAVVSVAFSGASPEEVLLDVTYQGCSEKGLCYSPIKKTVAVALDEATSISSLGTLPDFSSDDPAASLLKNGKLWLIITGFFGFGVLLSLTPCVLPMIPILSSIIIGRQHLGRLHTFNLSLAYTLGMAVSYALAGIAAGLSGRLLSNALQTPWALGTGAVIFVLLALSMFGFYEISLPSRLESRLVNVSNRIKGGRFLGVFVMGALASLIVSPCVAAPLAGALLYISQTHNVLLGGTALFALAMGMGVPLLLIGASAGTLLPKTGPWMNAVRNFFGVLLLAMAIWLISPLIPPGVSMALWAALLIVTAIFMRALDSLPPSVGSGPRFWKGIGVIALIFGITLLLGALSGAKSPLQPLAGFSSRSQSEHQGLDFQRVKSLAELESILQSSGKPVLLDFYADWCVACKEMEKFTFSDSRVQQALRDVVLIQADVTSNTEADVELLKRFHLFGPPGIIFFNDKGIEQDFRVIGFQDAETFLNSLQKVNIN